jgi:hypothetical protein
MCEACNPRNGLRNGKKQNKKQLFYSEELAKQLQEEERQAAMAEANDPQRRQGQRPPRPQGQQVSSQQRPTRNTSHPREDKKSDVSFNFSQICVTI